MFNEKNQEPLVSIIIPVYNAENYLKRCIDSLLAQSYMHIEIILVDDKSSDRSAYLCKKYENENPLVRAILLNKNGGAGIARRTGEDYANGKYIIYMDNDDWVEPDFVNKMVEIAEENHADFVACGYFINIPKLNITQALVIEGEKTVFDRNNIALAVYEMDRIGILNPLWNKMIERRFMQESNLHINSLDDGPGGDLILNCELLKKAKTVAIIQEPLYHYMKINDDSYVAKYIDDAYSYVQKCNSARLELYKYYHMIGCEQYMKVYEGKYIAYLHSCIPNLFRTKNTLKKKEIIQQLTEIIRDKNLMQYCSSYKSKDLFLKIFFNIIKNGNVTVAYVIYKILFFVRANFKSIYNIIFRFKISRNDLIHTR